MALDQNRRTRETNPDDNSVFRRPSEGDFFNPSVKRSVVQAEHRLPFKKCATCQIRLTGWVFIYPNLTVRVCWNCMSPNQRLQVEKFYEAYDATHKVRYHR